MHTGQRWAFIAEAEVFGYGTLGRAAGLPVPVAAAFARNDHLGTAVFRSRISRENLLAFPSWAVTESQLSPY